MLEKTFKGAKWSTCLMVIIIKVFLNGNSFGKVEKFFSPSECNYSLIQAPFIQNNTYK